MEELKEQKLIVRPVCKSDTSYAQVKQLYREAFPAFERSSLAALRLFARKREVEFSAYFDPVSPNLVCGLTYNIVVGPYIYILYLAVNKDMRGQGLGTRILNTVKQQHPEASLVLEIEPLDKTAKNYNQRVRRLAFYERNGFKLAGYDLFEGKVRYTMLATGDNFDPDAFARTVRKLSHGLYRFKIVPA